MQTTTTTPIVEHITPAMAKLFLKKQHQNRNLSGALVDKYAATMLAGNWKETHQGIAFDSEGRLCDGAHRMTALAMLEGKVLGINVLVTRGLSEEAIQVLDSGRARSISDRLAIRHGDKLRYANNRVAVANVLLASRGSQTDQQVTKIVDETSGAFDTLMSIPYALSALRSATIAALAYAFPVDPVAVMRFARSLVDGDELKKGSAAYVARKQLVEKPLIGSTDARQVEFRRALSALRSHMVENRVTMKLLRDSPIGVEYFNRKRAALGLEVYARID